MSIVGAEYYVEVHGITARCESLGHSLTVVRGAAKYRIDLPEEPDSFEFERVGPTRLAHQQSGSSFSFSDSDPREYEPTVAMVRGGHDLVDIRLIRIVANTPSTLSVESFDREDPLCTRALHRLFFELWEAVLRLAQDFCQWVSIRLDQYWIEPSGKYPRIVNLVELVDIEAKRSFGDRIGTPPDFLRVVGKQVLLGVDAFRRIGESLEHPGSPAADEVLLAEAWHLIGTLPRPTSAPERATLLAAIALEIRIKRVLRVIEGQTTRASGRRTRHRSPHYTFLQIARRELGAAAQRGLASRVQQLFETRHQIAHDGFSVDHRTAKHHVQVARQAFFLLRQVETDRRNQLAYILGLVLALENTRRSVNVPSMSCQRNQAHLA